MEIKRGQQEGAILITLLSESLSGFNGSSFTAGVNSAVLRAENLPGTHAPTGQKYTPVFLRDFG